MQLAPQNLEKWSHEAPALLESAAIDQVPAIMKRDPATDHCVQFSAGWCRIHQHYGSDFLGDACHFYPRINRALNDTVLTALALSCPEAARLMLYGDAPFSLQPHEALRQPFFLTNYLPEGVSPEAALAVHQRFVEEGGDTTRTAERNLMHVSTVARAMEQMNPGQWAEAVPFYFTMAEGRLPTPEAHPHDLIHLVQALCGLVLASQATNRPALMALLARMQEAVGMRIGADGALEVLADAPARGIALLHKARAREEALQPVLRRYLQSQLAQAMFPHAGLGGNLSERLTILAVRFATFRLALLTGDGSPASVIETAYVLARFMDHLADPTLSLAIYRETGWVREARLRGLLGDA